MRALRLEHARVRALRLEHVRVRALRPEHVRVRALRLGQNLEVAAQEIAQLGCCYLGEKTLESGRLGKAFGKVPNIVKTTGNELPGCH